MRKLLLLIALLGLGYFSQGQTIINNIGGITTLNKVKYQITIDSAFRKPLDTLASAPVFSEAFKNGVEYYKAATGFWVAKLGGVMLNFGSAPGWKTGTLAARPAASTLPAGTQYTATDLGIIYLDTLGTGWKQISSAGGGSLGDSSILYLVPPLNFKNDTTLQLDTAGAHFNAYALQGIPISRIPPTNGQVLVFNSTMDSLVWGAGGGGSGLTSFTSPNSTITIGGTLTAPTADINLSNANTWVPAQSFTGGINTAGNILFTGTTGTLNVGSLTNIGNISYFRNYVSDGAWSAATGNAANFVFKLSKSGTPWVALQGNSLSGDWYLTRGATQVDDSKSLFHVNGLLKGDSDLNLNRNQAVLNVTTSLAVGCSYETGNGITPTWPALVSTYYGVTLNNQAISATGMWSYAKEALINEGIGSRNLLMVGIFGFNDTRWLGGAVPTVRTYAKDANCLNAILANHFSKTALPADGAGVLRYGTWSSFNATTYGGKFTNGASSPNTNDSITYPFTDTSAVVVLSGWATGGANFEMYLDNVDQGNYSTSNQFDSVSVNGHYDAQGPMAFVFTNLPNCAHRIKLVNTNGGGTLILAVDYFGSLVDKNVADSIPVVIMQSPYLDSTGYAYPGFQMPNGSQTIQQLNTTLDSTVKIWLAKEPFFPIYIAHINDSLSATTLYTDHIHRTEAGWVQIAAAAQASIVSPVGHSAGSIFAQNGRMYYMIGTGANAYPIPLDGQPKFNLNGGQLYALNGTVSGAAFTLTTIGTSAPATYSGGVLNIPQYSSGGISGLTSTYIPVATGSTTIANSILTANSTGLGIGVASPAYQLDVKATHPGIQLTDGSTNAGYIGQFNDAFGFAANRSFTTGAFFSASKASSQIQVVGAAGSGYVSVSTTNTNGGTPSEVARFTTGIPFEIEGATPAMQAVDAGGTNAAFFGNFADLSAIGVNRNPMTGAITNTGKTSVELALSGGAGDGHISFYTTNTNNTTPTEHMRFFGSGDLGIGTTTDLAASILTVASTTQGFLEPRMTTTQQNAISSPAEGLQVYDNVLHEMAFYNGSAWIDIAGSSTPTLQQVLTAGATMTGANTVALGANNFTFTSSGGVLAAPTAALGTNTTQVATTAFVQQATILHYPHTIFTPTTGGTVTLVNNQYNIVNPSGTLAALTITLPSSPSNNDVVYIKYTQAVTAVTYSGGTVVDGITAPTAGGLVVLTFDSGTTSWY